MRLLHASLGLAVIAVSYALFRQLLPRRWALFAACVLGCSHSLLMISRMAMRENTAVLIEVAALALLLRGLRHGHPLSTFLGGVVAGLGFYVYYPARFTIVLWAAVPARRRARGRRMLPRQARARLGAVAATGFVLAATPIVVAEQKAPAGKVALQRHALLVFPEARETQRGWVFASSVSAGIRKNVVWGLTTFNNTVVDHSWIYPNYSHGFVDPFTGALLWVGVAVVVLALLRRRSDPWPLVFLGGFAILFLTFALLVNKAPNYTRLLVTLPFVAFLVTAGVRFLAGQAGGLATRWRPGYAKGAAAARLNRRARPDRRSESLDRVGLRPGREGARRLHRQHRALHRVESRRPGKTFYIATVDAEPYRYYEWGYPIIWKERLSIFAGRPVTGRRGDQPRRALRSHGPAAVRSLHAP